MVSLSASAFCRCPLALAIALICLVSALDRDAGAANVTLLVPSRASVDLPNTAGKTAANKVADKAVAKAAAKADTEGKEAAEAVAGEEIDVLITMMQAENSKGLNMEMPQLFSVVRYGGTGEQPERHDLLGDVEEIRFLGERAWGANVALARPGLYHFLLEGRPWWDQERQIFLQHYVKTTVPVHNVSTGWESPVGLLLEIQPLTRPFGLTAPVLFRARALFNGQAMKDAPVFLHSVTSDGKQALPSPWHASQEGRTNSAGEFAFVLNRAGWWCCVATMPGDSLKGDDGNPRERELSAVFWLYVDAPAGQGQK